MADSFTAEMARIRTKLNDTDSDDASAIINVGDELLGLIQRTKSFSPDNVQRVFEFAFNVGILAAEHDMRPAMKAWFARSYNAAKMREAKAGGVLEKRLERRDRANKALNAAAGDADLAAKRLGISVRTLNRWLVN